MSHYTCCEDGMLSQVLPTGNSGLCPACQPRGNLHRLTDNDRHEVHAFASFLRLVPPSLPDDWLKATLTEAANMNWEDEQLADVIARKRDGMWADSIRAALEDRQ